MAIYYCRVESGRRLSRMDTTMQKNFNDVDVVALSLVLSCSYIAESFDSDWELVHNEQSKDTQFDSTIFFEIVCPASHYRCVEGHWSATILEGLSNYDVEVGTEIVAFSSFAPYLRYNKASVPYALNGGKGELLWHWKSPQIAYTKQLGEVSLSPVGEVYSLKDSRARITRHDARTQ